MHTALHTLSAFATLFLPLVRASCECGYTVNSTLYTDLIESDFLHLQNITTDTDWTPQEYQISAEIARGPYGKNPQKRNVVANPLKSQYDWSGKGINGADPGLQLIVRGGDPGKGKLIPMAELVTNRSDILYGSFRAGMKIAAVNGTCGAFFWVCTTPPLDTMGMSAFAYTKHIVLERHPRDRLGISRRTAKCIILPCQLGLTITPVTGARFQCCWNA